METVSAPKYANDLDRINRIVARARRDRSIALGNLLASLGHRSAASLSRQISRLAHDAEVWVKSHRFHAH